MSSWTYVVGAIEVDTYGRTSAESIYIAQSVVDHLPKITGGERDANIYVNLVDGYNSGCSHDEFGNYSNLSNRNQYKMFESQTKVVITINGSLRDRHFIETIREATSFINRLSKRLDVIHGTLKVIGYKQEIDVMRGEWVQNNGE